MVFVGFEIGFRNRIGNLLGEGKVVLAKKMTKYTIIINVVFALFFYIIMLTFRDSMIALFTSDVLVV